MEEAEREAEAGGVRMRSGRGKGLEEVVFSGGEVERGVKGGAKRRAVEESGSGWEMRVIRRRDR